MANDLMTEPEKAAKAGPMPVQPTNPSGLNGRLPSRAPDSLPADGDLKNLLGQGFEEKPVWAELYENLRDLLFPPKLPPLELTSKPIAVADPMAVKRSPLATLLSVLFNGAVLAVILYMARHQIIHVLPTSLRPTMLDANIAPLPLTLKKGPVMGGGGGGGDHDIIDPSKGHLPKLAKMQITPPEVARIEHPKLAVEPTINVQKDIKLPDDPNMPLIGLPQSTNVKLASNGQGGGGGMGTGQGTGLGKGSGNGLGPGSNGNTGGGVERIGNGVSAPVPILTVDADFSDEARRAKYQGVVLVSLIVDAQGNPQNVRVARSLGMGLDEKAIEAVKQFRFKPAMKNGKPVAVFLNYEVNFRLY